MAKQLAAPYGRGVGTIGKKIDERGTLANDNGQLVFRRELGGRLNVDGVRSPTSCSDTLGV